jgi:hypothetical protein
LLSYGDKNPEKSYMYIILYYFKLLPGIDREIDKFFIKFFGALR